MEQKEDLFEIKLDEQGARSMQKVFRLTRISFWFALLVELFILAYTIWNYFKYVSVETPEGSRSYYWDLRIYTGYVIVYTILVILQGYYFLSFARQAKRSIELNDSYSFNNSFSWIQKSLVTGLILIGMNGLYFLQLIIRG